MTFLKASGSVLKANVEKGGKDGQRSISTKLRKKKDSKRLGKFYVILFFPEEY